MNECIRQLRAQQIVNVKIHGTGLHEPLDINLDGSRQNQRKGSAKNVEKIVSPKHSPLRESRQRLREAEEEGRGLEERRKGGGKSFFP